MSLLPYEPSALESLSEQYVRLFGRRPSAAELAAYRRAQGALWWRIPARARRRAAVIITRL